MTRGMRRQFDARAQSLPVHTTHSPLTRRCISKAQHHQTNRTSQQAQWLVENAAAPSGAKPAPLRHDKNTVKSRQLGNRFVVGLQLAGVSLSTSPVLG